MSFPDEPTVYLDVSHMLGNRLQTGIQRVVRQLARYGPETCGAFQRNCRLVQSLGGRFYRLRYEHIDLGRRHPLFRLAERRLGRQLLKKIIPRTAAAVEPRGGDILLTLNATWDVPQWHDAVADFGRTGFVATVMYDLTPQSHPQYHTPELGQRFAAWLRKLTGHSDHWIGISGHVAGELQKYLRSDHVSRGQFPLPSISHFRLGSDFTAGDVPAQTGARTPSLRPGLAQFLSTNQPILLLVGTVEPRKNQVAAVQACRQLWQAGWPGRLLLMGRLGWKCDAIRDELLSLPPDQFHWVRDGSDAELHEAYRRATALVFPSWEEGFGLPIVEALSQGTPVLASDHAVHQEVGQQACEYFPADSPDRLAQLIRHHHADGFRTLRSRATRFVPISWEQSCRELIADVLVAARDRQPDVGRASRNVSPPQRRAG